MADISTTVDDVVNKDIMELMGIGDAPESVKRDLYTKMLETIQKRVAARIDELLSDEDVAQWKQLIESGDSQKVDEFLQSKNINTEAITLQETLIYKTELAELAKGLKPQTMPQEG